MPKNTKEPEALAVAAPDVAAEVARWLAHLAAERRMSPKTVEAYGRDVSQFPGFLAGHLGGRPSLKHLARLSPADVRAFMAARRAEGIGNPSPMRTPPVGPPFAPFPQPNP